MQSASPGLICSAAQLRPRPASGTRRSSLKMSWPNRVAVPPYRMTHGGRGRIGGAERTSRRGTRTRPR
eukprot:5114430-Alexandrium_andersonii.AAC.1